MRLIWMLRHRLICKLCPKVRSIYWMIFIAIAYVILIYPYYQELEVLRQQTELISVDELNTKKGPQLPTVTSDLETFYAFFSKESKLQEVLQRIHDAAPRHSLVLPHGDFRRIDVPLESRSLIVEGSSQALVRYEVTLLVRGNFNDLRSYISEVLNQERGVSLSLLKFMRKDPNSLGGDFSLQFEVYLLREY